MKRVLAVVVAAAACAGAAAGCAANNPGALTASAERLLIPAVQHVRDAAASGSYSRLRVAVADLETLVRQEEDAGQVTPPRAAAIMDAADALLQDASPSPAPTRPTSPSPTSTSPTPSPTSPSPTPSPTTPSPTPTTSTSSSQPVVSLSAGVP